MGRPNEAQFDRAFVSRQAAEIAADRRPIFFFHVPKTGGRTVDKSMIDYFGEENVATVQKNKSLFADILATRKDKVVRPVPGAPIENRHVSGHFASLSLIEGREEEFLKACFWRHPADWMLSLYNFRHHRNRTKLKRTFGFRDFVLSMLPNPMTEHFLLYCGDTVGLRYFFMSDMEKFEAACALITRFDIFADIRKVDAFVEAMRPADRERSPDRNRIDAKKKTLATLDEETRAWVTRRSPVDDLIHRIALGEPIETVRKDAAALTAGGRRRAVGAILRQPYHRIKVWIIPFI